MREAQLHVALVTLGRWCAPQQQKLQAKGTAFERIGDAAAAQAAQAASGSRKLGPTKRSSLAQEQKQDGVQARSPRA
jgi:hypothetical protein